MAPPVGKHYARLELLGADSPGLVSMVADFLARHSLNIVSMDTRVYTADVDGDDAGTAGAEAPNAGAVVAAAAPHRIRPGGFGAQRLRAPRRV